MNIIVIIPVGRRLAADTHSALLGLNFKKPYRLHGIQETRMDWDEALELSMSHAPNPPATHLLVWGEVDATQEQALQTFSSDIPGGRCWFSTEPVNSRPRGPFNIWACMDEMGLTLMPKPGPVEL